MAGMVRGKHPNRGKGYSWWRSLKDGQATIPRRVHRAVEAC